MRKALMLNRKTGGGKYIDVIDVAEYLGRVGDCGSAANALAVMVRQSTLFMKTAARLKKRGKAPQNRGGA